jgi:hypothetical protein
LRARRENEALGDHRILAQHERMTRDSGHFGERSKTQAVGGLFDPLEPRDGIDVDEGARPHHVELHQVENGGAAGDELGFGRSRRSRRTGIASKRLRHRGRVVRAHINERTHQALLISDRASLIAATMLG